MIRFMKTLRAFLVPALGQGARIKRLEFAIASLYQSLVAQRDRETNPKDLLGYGYKVFSQYDEDGIIAEICRRLDIERGHFVEFGADDGLQNNTLHLLLQGWKGAWMEGDRELVDRVEAHFAPMLESGQLSVKQAFVTAENIDTLLGELQVPEQPDLLSIDIDGNDYWVWRAICNHRPRIVSIEYNPAFGPRIECRVKYDPNFVWRRTRLFGASLKALENLGRQKGYSLVGCGIGGVNAFFVRDDLVDDKFAAPFTSENHYQPPRFYLRMPVGHPPDAQEMRALQFGPAQGIGT